MIDPAAPAKELQEGLLIAVRGVVVMSEPSERGPPDGVSVTVDQCFGCIQGATPGGSGGRFRGVVVAKPGPLHHPRTFGPIHRKTRPMTDAPQRQDYRRRYHHPTKSAPLGTMKNRSLADGVSVTSILTDPRLKMLAEGVLRSPADSSRWAASQ